LAGNKGEKVARVCEGEGGGGDRKVAKETIFSQIKWGQIPLKRENNELKKVCNSKK